MGIPSKKSSSHDIPSRCPYFFMNLFIGPPSTLHLGHFFPLRFAQGFALTLDLHGTKTTTARVFEKPKSGCGDRPVRHADWGSPVAPRNSHVTEVSKLKKWFLHKTNRTSPKKNIESLANPANGG